MRFNNSGKATKFWLLLMLLFSPLVSNQAFYNSQQKNHDTSNAVIQFPSSAIILQYHHIADNTPYSTSTSVALFKKQMQLLKTLNFKVWPLSKIIQKLQNAEPLPDQVVALSFDDAYSSFYSNAWPILKSYQYPATIFVATSHISDKPSEFLSWQQLNFLSTQGIEIGSHSDSHNYLARQLYFDKKPQTIALIIDDIKLSLEKIKKNIMVDSTLFAYPYGEYNDALAEVVDDLDLIGFGQHSGPINQYSNFSALPRFPASNQFGTIKSLREKLFTVPFNDLTFQPTETFIRNNPPKLILQIADKSLNINCYAPNQGAIPTAKEAFSDFQQVTVQATKALEKGRSRYNCTASADEHYFFWFSQLWINLEK